MHAYVFRPQPYWFSWFSFVVGLPGRLGDRLRGWIRGAAAIGAASLLALTVRT